MGLSEEALYYIGTGIAFTIGIWLWVWWHVKKGWKQFEKERGDD